jgi:rod shape-determining protein MreC
MKKMIYYGILSFILIIFYYFSDNFYFWLNNNTITPFMNINTYYDNALLNDYKSLLNSYNIPNLTNYDYVYTKVLYHDIYNFNKEITILKGSREGLKEGMAVISKNGLIGLISNVNESSSSVMLLSNKKMNLSIKINNSYGMLQVKNNNIIINGITNNDVININDNVYTSGLGSLPSDIYVGKIDKIDGEGLNRILKIYVDNNDLNYLIVLKDLK